MGKFWISLVLLVNVSSSFAQGIKCTEQGMRRRPTTILSLTKGNRGFYQLVKEVRSPVFFDEDRDFIDFEPEIVSDLPTKVLAKGMNCQFDGLIAECKSAPSERAPWTYSWVEVEKIETTTLVGKVATKLAPEIRIRVYSPETGKKTETYNFPLNINSSSCVQI